jgi:hypothetical protein
LVVEMVLAVLDFFRDTLSGRNFFSELQFVPTRVAICVLLREWVTAGAQIDAARGLPVIHVNYLGYDEQAHHRGPSSAFAHWSLRGIDEAIERIWKAAHRSRRRHYDLWVYSDHGQEAVTPFQKKTGSSLRSAVLRVLNGTGAGRPFGEAPEPARPKHAALLSAARSHQAEADGAPGHGGVQITSMGPVGHVYLARTLSEEEKESLARRLAGEAGVPWVYTKGDDGMTARSRPSALRAGSRFPRGPRTSSALRTPI